MEFGKRHVLTIGPNTHNGLLPAPTCCGLVADLLWTCYGETGVMDFGPALCQPLRSIAR